MQKPVKTVKRQLLRIGSCALSALMMLGSIPAAAIDDGVTATYDEAYYAMTDYYGNLIRRQRGQELPHQRHLHTDGLRRL